MVTKCNEVMWSDQLH